MLRCPPAIACSSFCSQSRCCRSRCSKVPKNFGESLRGVKRRRQLVSRALQVGNNRRHVLLVWCCRLDCCWHEPRRPNLRIRSGVQRGAAASCARGSRNLRFRVWRPLWLVGRQPAGGVQPNNRLQAFRRSKSISGGHMISARPHIWRLAVGCA